MEDFCKYKILKDHKLVIQVYKNELYYEKAKEFKKIIFSDKEFKSGFNFLIDLRQVKFNVTNESTKEYNTFITSDIISQGTSQIAVLTQTPEQVAYSTILGHEGSDLSFHLNIFSTIEGALRWLNIDRKKYSIISTELNNLLNN